jgi:hypothetical protein
MKVVITLHHVNQNGKKVGLYPVIWHSGSEISTEVFTIEVSGKRIIHMGSSESFSFMTIYCYLSMHRSEPITIMLD